MDAKHSSPCDISEGDLCKRSKSLKATKEYAHADSLDYDKGVAEELTSLYNKLKGDINAIFEELGESPRKAVKHPPSNAKEFGIKYAQGFYTYADCK